jgi:hypothetical protein
MKSVVPGRKVADFGNFVDGMEWCRVRVDPAAHGHHGREVDMECQMPIFQDYDRRPQPHD